VQRRIIEGQGGAEYDFTHDRLREVTYAELSPVRRRFLHRRIAYALEELQSGDAESVHAQLAAHLEAGGAAAQAVDHYAKAAAVARHRYADEEAAGHLRHAIALCTTFPENAERDRRELELLVTLGPVLVTTQGYSRPEVGALYERALVLARRLDRHSHLIPVLSGAWVFHVVRGQLEISRELAQQCLDLANQQGLLELSVMGELMLGGVNFHQGRLRASQSHLERTMAANVGRVAPCVGALRRTRCGRLQPVVPIASRLAAGRRGAGATQERGSARRGQPR
jgi:predicted ATPase